MGSLKKVLAVGLLSLASLPAIAAYVSVYGNGAGLTYEAARASAISNGSLYCAAQGGTIIGVWLESLAIENEFGWNVQVYNSGCFIPD